MSMAVKSLLLMAIAGLAMSQPSGHGIISGTVIDAASGDPVRKAVVTVTWQGTPRSWATAQTDGSGNFKFDGLRPGKYDLRARKQASARRFTAPPAGRELGDFVKLDEGETVSGLKLRFLHFATISGHIFDPDGDPMPGANVLLFVQAGTWAFEFSPTARRHRAMIAANIKSPASFPANIICDPIRFAAWFQEFLEVARG